MKPDCRIGTLFAPRIGTGVNIRHRNGMYTPELLTSRLFSISKLRIKHHGSTWSPTSEYDELVRLQWNNLLGNAKTRVWDGTYYRVLYPSAFKEEGDAPILLGTIAYRYIVTFPSLFQEHFRLALDPLNHLSTAALIRTADDLYLFGVRKQDGTVDLIGGGAQCDEIEINCGADLEKNIYKEIKEEAGLSTKDIEDLAGIGTVVSSTSNLLIVAHVLLKLDSAEAQKRFQQRTDDEMNRLVFVSEDRTRDFLTQLGDYRSLLVQLDW